MDCQKTHDFFMSLALKEAKKAFKKKEVPIGAVIVKNDLIISKAYNLRECGNNPIGHAEILAIRKASHKLKSWRLENCRLYVSLEPCLMCLGAIIQARISDLIYSCPDFKAGFSSYYQLDKQSSWKHKIKIAGGIHSKESSSLLKDFFKQLRS